MSSNRTKKTDGKSRKKNVFEAGHQTERWSKISKKEMVEAVNKFANNLDHNVSEVDFRPRDSVWGRAVSHLFNANTKLDRFWCRTFYLKYSTSQAADNNEIEVYCYCEKSYEELGDATMIACDGGCGAWYHGVCLGINPKKFSKTQPFTCPKCVSGVQYPKFFENSRVAEGDGGTDWETESNSSSDDSSAISCGENTNTASFNSDNAEEFDSGTNNAQKFSEPCGGNSGMFEDSSGGESGEVTTHETFQLRIPWNEWSKIKPELVNPEGSRGYQYRMKSKNWGDVFNAQFETKEKGCVLAFQKHRVEVGKKANHVIAVAVCKRKPLCTMKYTFVIRDEPKPGNDAIVTVSPQGSRKHDKTHTAARIIQGDERSKLKKKLVNTKPSRIFLDRYLKRKDPSAVQQGNITSVQSLPKFHKIRLEAIKGTDMHEDFVKDLHLTMKHLNKDARLAHDLVPGFIQGFSLKPFGIVMCTAKQLRILRRLLSIRPSACLHVDATGRVESTVDGEVLLHYAIVVELGGPGAPCIPVCEFVSSKHDNVTIGNALRIFAYLYRQVNGIDRLNLGFLRVETDRSLAMIIAVLSAFEIGPLENYLSEAWRVLTGRVSGSRKQYKMGFVLHICRTHARRFIKKHINRRYTSTRARKLLTSWMYGFLHGRDIYRRVEDAVILCGTTQYTEEIKQCASDIRKQTQRTANYNPWISVEDYELHLHQRMKTRSPFGVYAYDFCNNRQIQLLKPVELIGGVSEVRTTRSELSGKISNPYYNISFLEYLLNSIFPYAPLLNLSLFYAAGIPVRGETNTPVESYFDITKNHDHANNLPMPCGRFIRAHLGPLLSRLEIFNDELNREIERERKQHRTNVRFQKNIQFARKSTSMKPPRRDVSEDQQHHRGSRTKDSNLGPHKAQGTYSPIRSPPNKKSKPQRSPADDNPKTSEETWGRAGKKPRVHPALSMFQALYRLQWGSEVVLSRKQVPLANSCSFDNVLTVLYFISKRHTNVTTYIHMIADAGDYNIRKLLQIFTAMENSDGVLAKTIFVTKLRKESAHNFPTFSQGSVSLHENTFEDYNMDFFKTLFEVERILVCENPRCVIAGSSSLYVNQMIVTDPNIFITKLNSSSSRRCPAGACKQYTTTRTFRFVNGPLPMLVYACAQDGIGVVPGQLPTTATILDTRYRMFAFTIHYGSGTSGHFYAVLIVGNQLVKYDGLSRSLRVVREFPAGHIVNLVFLIRE